MKKTISRLCSRQKGFTLIELLIVIVIIAILAGIIYVAVDPATRFKQARNGERWSSVNSILNAYMKYVVDNDGDEPVTTLIADQRYMIGTGTSYSDCSADGMANLQTNLVGKYLPSMPFDPKTEGAGEAKSYYYIVKDNFGRIIIGACTPELGETISVSR